MCFFGFCFSPPKEYKRLGSKSSYYSRLHQQWSEENLAHRETIKKYPLKVQAELSIVGLEQGLSTGTDLGTREASVIVWKHCVLSHLSWVLLTSGRETPRATGKCSTMLQKAPQWSFIQFTMPTVWRAKVLSYSHWIVNKTLKSIHI